MTVIALEGRLCRSVSLRVPWSGRWVASVSLEGAAPTGRVTLTWGSASLVGSVDPAGAGAWTGEAQVVIVGGLGWSSIVEAQWLQNDAGLLGAAVASQVAGLVGETLQAPGSAFRPLRVSYNRTRRAASATLKNVLAPGAAWWVGYDGITRAGARPAPAAPARVEVLDLEPGRGVAMLDADDVGQVLVGSVIAAAPPRRATRLRIVELRASVGAEGQRLAATVQVIP